jgi:hypothetical protein
MPVGWYAFIGMVAGVALWGFGRWRESKAVLGEVPILPHFYIQLTGLIVFLVFAADFVAAVTGVTWTSPFRR